MIVPMGTIQYCRGFTQPAKPDLESTSTYFRSQEYLDSLVLDVSPDVNKRDPREMPNYKIEDGEK